MEIQIDTREHELIRLCKHFLEIMPTCKDIELVVKPLPIGDVIMNYKGSEKVIIERKSLGDLSSSIKDGRYEEQSYRLNGTDTHNHNIIYLIEGDMNKINVFKNRIDKTTLYSSMISILCYKGFSLMRSTNMEETAIILCNMAYKIRKSEMDGRRMYYQHNSVPVKEEINTVIKMEEINMEKEKTEDKKEEKNEDKNEEKEYCGVVKRVKKENVTKDNIGEIMLCQIPGISSITALAIMSQYKTLPNLVLKLKENKDCLKDIQYVNTSGQTRKISKTVITNIVQYLME